MKRRKLLRWLLVLGMMVIVTGAAGGAWFVAGELVAPKCRVVGACDPRFAVKSTTLSSASGSQIATWYWDADSPQKQATVILLHGMGADRRMMLDRARLFHEAGYSVVMIDFQAHGESPGERITMGHLEKHDVRAAVEFVRARRPGDKIAVVGCSLGAAAAVLGSPLGIDALVVESVYPTIEEAVHDRVARQAGALSYVLSPLLLCQLSPRLGISPAELRPIDRIGKAGCPVLVAAGELDLHTPLDETQRIFAAAREPKELVIFTGAAHEDLLGFNRPLYIEKVLAFVERHCSGQ